MKYEFFQNISNILILLGVVLTALGGYGSYYFGKRVENWKDQSNKIETNVMALKVDSLLVGNNELKQQLSPFQDYARRLYPNATDEDALDKLRNDFENTKKELASEKKALALERNTISSLTSTLKIKFLGDWKETPFPPQVITSVHNTYFMLFEDTKKNYPRIDFYATEIYDFSLNNKQAEFFVRQSVKNGANPIGSLFETLEKYDRITYFIPFILYNNFNTPYIDVLEIEVELFINGKIVKRFRSVNRLRADVKIYNNNKSTAWAVFAINNKNGILNTFTD